jgi:hypothetical protein
VTGVGTPVDVTSAPDVILPMSGEPASAPTEKPFQVVPLSSAAPVPE